jgi:hypothetical protein
VHARAGGVSGPALEVFVRLQGENGEPAAPPSQNSSARPSAIG